MQANPLSRDQPRRHAQTAMGVKELRREVNLKGRALYALLDLGYQLDRTRRHGLLRELRSLDYAPAKQLRHWRDTIAQDFKRLSKFLDCKLGIADLTHAYELLFNNPGKMLNVPKWAIDLHHFGRFENTWPGWDSVPPHAHIQFDATGENCGPGRYEFFLPEASLYEDMCFAYNNAALSQKDAHTPPLEKRKVKARSFYLRNAVLAAFYFVEAYLNGIAFDYLARSKEELMTEETDLLPERDSKKGRAGLVGFQRKIMEYPKAILGLQHPPLTESNCTELKFLLNEAKDIRDAIVHQSPSVNPDTLRTSKLKPLIALELDDVSKIVDTSISFVRKLNTILGKHGQDLSWLVDRDASGIFPDKAFE